ncbi:NAD-dependent epimerase/dehydratase family protein [Planococcus sp. APC 4015]|nr:NAD-dependent epimerase/dehydratase family protein [Planococcus sp. APC 4015]
MLGGTGFIGRCVVERLNGRGDEVAVVHRGLTELAGLPPVRHIHADRLDLSSQSRAIREFRADAVVDSNALTGADVDAVTGVLPDVATVVLSSQDVYQAVAAFRSGVVDAAVPLSEDSELRRTRYPYAGRGYAAVPDDYEKLDVEERWLPRGAVALRLPMVYGPHDDQQRESPILRRAAAGQAEIPIGVGGLLWTRSHVEDVASAVLAALDTRAADGLAVNVGEQRVYPIRSWFQQILDAADSPAVLAEVANEAVPADLSISRGSAQHLLASVQRASDLLGWNAGDPRVRVRESVLWHLKHTRFEQWSDEEREKDSNSLRNR